MDETIYTLIHKVNSWAKEHDSETYYCASRFSFWRNAMHFGIITKEQMEMGADHYGELWHFTGD